MTANRQLQLLLWILYVVVLVRISEGTPFSDCRVDIQGPYRNPNGINTPTRVVIRASESEPAVFYCRYTYHDPHQWYSFRLHIDILDECGSDDLVEVSANDTEDFLYEDFNFTVTRTEINHTNNMTTFKVQVFVSSNIPTLIAKCHVKYLQNGNGSRQIFCSSSSTFAIVSNDTACTQPYSTEPSTVTLNFSTDSPPLITSDNIIQLPPSAFGSIVGILCAIVAIETLLLMIIFFVKCKKFRRGNVNKVNVMQCDVTHNNVAARPAAAAPKI